LIDGWIPETVSRNAPPEKNTAPEPGGGDDDDFENIPL
jgi:hypothetical protein